MKTMNDGLEAGEGAGGGWAVTTMATGDVPAVSDRIDKAKRRSKRRAAKLRAVWISFTGRIVAQFVGSAASIVLGLALIHNYKTPVHAPEQAAPGREPVSYQGRVARMGDSSGRHRPSIVVLPVDDYSRIAPDDLLAKALTESVTASLAERGSLAVLSRTSASQLGTRPASVPAIARELGVDLVLESSITRSANRVRVVAQLIDGRSDEHLWTARYDRDAGNALGLQAEIADQIARGIDAALNIAGSRPSVMASRSTGAGSVVDLDARARVLPPAESPAGIR